MGVTPTVSVGDTPTPYRQVFSQVFKTSCSQTSSSPAAPPDLASDPQKATTIGTNLPNRLHPWTTVSSWWHNAVDVSNKPTGRQLRIIRNLIAKNQIWETVGREYFTQFDESTERDIRIRPSELQQMEICGWIRRLRHPQAHQRLDYYELTAEGASHNAMAHRKSPQREAAPDFFIRPRRRA